MAQSKSNKSSSSKKSGLNLVIMPVSADQSGLYNVKELSKQYQKLVADLSKRMSELKTVNEETVSSELQQALESVYSYALSSNSPSGKKAKKNKREKDPNSPKKPLSNYMVYCMRHRADIQAKNPEARPTDISRILGSNWNGLTPEQKAKYIDTTVSA
jgi:hypothetical protein